MNNNAKFAFWYMLSLVALIFMALSTGMIFFQVINKTVADVLAGVQGYTDEIMKFAISAIIIATPLYYWMLRLIKKAFKKGELKDDSGIRRWLTYFILFVSAVVAVGWLIATINSWLNGELSLKFILKTLTVLIITGTIFTYYFYDIRQGAKAKPKVNLIYLIVSLAIVLGAFITSFFFVESPQNTRVRLYDQNVVNDLSSLDSGINSYYAKNKSLPQDLNALIETNDYYVTKTQLGDKAGTQKYAYKVVDATHYELCATFKMNNKNLTDDKTQYADPRFLHEAGYYCFKRQVDLIIKDGQALGVPPVPVR
jgi:hypothetical protein